jgi:hypothetical protein
MNANGTAQTRLTTNSRQVVGPAGGAPHEGQRRRAPRVTTKPRGRLLSRTDLVVRLHGVTPLSVAADRLALPAMRAAWPVPKLGGAPVDLTGRGKIVEVA